MKFEIEYLTIFRPKLFILFQQTLYLLKDFKFAFMKLNYV